MKKILIAAALSAALIIPASPAIAGTPAPTPPQRCHKVPAFLCNPPTVVRGPNGPISNPRPPVVVRPPVKCPAPRR